MTRIVSWKAARGLRVSHLVHGLGSAHTNCGVPIPTARLQPRVALGLIWSAKPAARPTEMCIHCWPVDPVAASAPVEA